MACFCFDVLQSDITRLYMLKEDHKSIQHMYGKMATVIVQYYLKKWVS